MRIIGINVSGDMATVSFDNADSITMPYLLAFDNRLEKGLEIDRQEYDRLSADAEVDRCYNYALRYLTKYSATAKSLKRKLVEKEYSYPAANIVVDRLIDLGLLNDRRYAERLVHNKVSRLGKRRLREELYQKGISRDIIDEVLSEIPDDDIMESGLAVANKWLASHSIEDRRDMDKFVRFMQYRGYGFDVIKRALREMNQEEYDVE